MFVVGARLKRWPMSANMAFLFFIVAILVLEFGGVEVRRDQIEARLDLVEARLDEADGKFDLIQFNFENVHKKLDFVIEEIVKIDGVNRYVDIDKNLKTLKSR